MTTFRFWAALFQKPNPRSCSPQLSRKVFLLTSSGEKAAPFLGSSDPSGVPVPLEELTTSSRPASPVLVFVVEAFGLYSMPRRSEKYSTYPFSWRYSPLVPLLPIVPASHFFRLPTSISTAFITPLVLQLLSVTAMSRTSPSRTS